MQWAFEAQDNDNAIRQIDEPYAAFVDLKFRCPDKAGALLREDADLLPFDFGGGACDVANFRVDARGRLERADQHSESRQFPLAKRSCWRSRELD